MNIEFDRRFAEFERFFNGIE